MPAASASPPITTPTVIGSRQRTLVSRANRVRTTMPTIAMPRKPRVASSVSSSFHDRISAYRRRNDSGISTNGRTRAGVSPAIPTSVRIGAPPMRRSSRSNVYVRSIRPLVFFVSYDAVTSFQRLALPSIQVFSAISARRWPESALTAGRRSASESFRSNPIMRPSGANWTRASRGSPGTNARTDQVKGATSLPRTRAFRES